MVLETVQGVERVFNRRGWGIHSRSDSNAADNCESAG